MILAAKVMMLASGFVMLLMVADDAQRIGADGFHWSIGMFAISMIFFAGAL
jgi:hypothetical protein